MATLEVDYTWGCKVWEADARHGLVIEVDDDLEPDALRNLKPSGRKCVYFGRIKISEAYDELPGDMADWWSAIAEAEDITQVKLNGSVIWSLAQAAELGEIMAEVGGDDIHSMLVDFGEEENG